MRIKSFCFLLFLMFGGLLLNAKAQSGYGYSYIERVPSNQTVIAETGTVLDYNSWYYYDPGIQPTLYKDNVVIAQDPVTIANASSYISAWIQRPAEPRKTYKIHGDHYVRAYYYYIIGGQPRYVDQYGLNFFQGNFPTPYGFSFGQPAYYYYQTYKVATTFVSIQIPQPPPQISIDTAGAPPGITFVTALRGANLFGNSQNVQVSDSGVTMTVRPGQLPNTIEVLEIDVQIAQDAQVGERNVTLTVDGQTSNTVTFRVGDRTPQITSITPPEGNTGDQVPVTISGSSFGLNPLIQIDGTGVNPTITSATTTQINAVFSVADATYIGTRGVKIKSNGISGNGFILVPGNSDTSNSVGFAVFAPVVQIDDVPTIEKNGERTVNVNVSGLANANDRVRFTLKPISGATGEAKFDNNNNTIEKPNGTHSLKIKGIIESNQANKMTIEATPTNASNVLAHKEFTVVMISSLEFERINTTGTSPDVLLDNNPGNGVPGTDIGQRIFPDKNAPGDGTDRATLRVKATISPANVSNLKVYFASFDLDDPSANAAPIDTYASDGNDNNGLVNNSKSGGFSTAAGVTCANASAGTSPPYVSKIECPVTNNTTSANFKVTMQPGDNFAIAASLVSDYRDEIKINSSAGKNLINNANQTIPVSGEANTDNVRGLRTKMLTVWRKIHLEIDKMTPVTNNNHVTGSFTAAVTIRPGQNAFNVPIMTSNNQNLEVGRFLYGRVAFGTNSCEIRGNDEVSLTIKNGTGNAITINPGTPFTLYDDDDYNNDDPILDGDEGEQINLAQAIFAEIDMPISGAYVVSDRLWSDQKGYNQANVPFDLNVDTNNDAVVSNIANNNRNSAADESDEFWIGYFVIGYQPEEARDYDGYTCVGVNCRTERPLFAFTVKQNSTHCDCLNNPVCSSAYVCSTPPKGGIGSVILQEVIRDHNKWYLPRIITVDKTVAAHELGHQFGLQGDNFNSTSFEIMDYPNYNTSTGAAALFVPDHINIIRKRVKSPGQQ